MARINMRLSVSAIRSLAHNRWAQVAAAVLAGLLVWVLVVKEMERQADEAELQRVRRATKKSFDDLNELRRIKNDLERKGLSR